MDMYDICFHLFRLALQDKKQDIVVLGQKMLKLLSKERPEMEESLRRVLGTYEQSTRIMREFASQSIPIDADSRLELLKKEVVHLEHEPVWPANVHSELKAVLEERFHEDALCAEGLAPTRSILFVGPPGVGKTLAAKWLSQKLGRPLLTLDLASVMSSFLGRTGNNIRAVLAYAQKIPSVLLLDEFDSIAKRRSDDLELGELKRLVTVLLQSIDEWPPQGLLVAATNHPELLDPAVWRRFERVVEFPKPSPSEIASVIRTLIDDDYTSDLEPWIELFTRTSAEMSFADVVRQITTIRRNKVIHGESLSESFRNYFIHIVKELDKESRIRFAGQLLRSGYSQRQASTLTGISRDTLRRHFGTSEKADIKPI